MAENFFQLPLVQDHYLRAREQAAHEGAELYTQLVGRDLADHADAFAPRLESPAEMIFYMWFRALTLVRFTQFRLRPQQSLVIEGRTYRVDFEVSCNDTKGNEWMAPVMAWRPIAVEIDGHTFHEKSLQQVTYRNRRDRAVQRAEWMIFHFSFEELTTAPEECVREVLEFAFRQWLALWGPDEPDETEAT